MGALRTSEDGEEVVGGEARAARSDDDRAIDAPGRIIIDSAPITVTPRPAHKPPLRAAPQPAPQGRGGLGLVVVVYIVAIAALGAAIYERFFMA